jgi:ketol-acid reductoisomerase
MSPNRGSNRVAVVGFGSQGKAHAVRLAAGGCDVCVGLRSHSHSRSEAKRRGLTVSTPARAVAGRDTVAMLVPDQVATKLLAELSPHLQPGSLIVFAAGYPLVFTGAGLPEGHDVVLVAPHGPGKDLERGEAVSGFIGVHIDVTGRALARARAYAQAIGLKPLYETTPKHEAMGDLFGEQALLCGGLIGLTAAVARVMVSRGVPAENAYFETVAQLPQLAALLVDAGLEGFWREISDCAAAGSAQAAPRLFGRRFESELRALWDQIESGRFARHLQRQGRPATLPASWQVLPEIERAAKKRGGRKGPPQSSG